jgi:hypothetical protein
MTNRHVIYTKNVTVPKRSCRGDDSGEVVLLSWLKTRVQIRHGVHVAVAFLVIAASGCGWGPGDGIGPSATVTTQVELTREQPVWAVEFEASLEVPKDSAGIDGYLEQLHPDSGEMGGADLEPTYWDGAEWVEGRSSEIAQFGLNTFRFRWTVRLGDNVDSATVPVEARFYAIWTDRIDGAEPDESIVSDVELAIVSTTPLE